jgi:hypothetical protein
MLKGSGLCFRARGVRRMEDAECLHDRPIGCVRLTTHGSVTGVYSPLNGTKRFDLNSRKFLLTNSYELKPPRIAILNQTVTVGTGHTTQPGRVRSLDGNMNTNNSKKDRLEENLTEAIGDQQFLQFLRSVKSSC